jgi:hypothetical protein
MGRRTISCATTLIGEEEKDEEGRKDLREDLEENPSRRKRNFKPPETPQFHFAADKYFGSESSCL